MNNPKRRRRKRKPKVKSFGSVFALMVLTVLIAGGMTVKTNALKEKEAEYEKKEKYLLEEIDKQNQRSEEIEEYREYMQTKQYIEDMARQKLGLVYKDEIIFEADN